MTAIRILFTNHAKERCKQRKVSEKWVTARLQRIPIVPGTHEVTFEGTVLKVVFHDFKTHRVVITVFSVLIEEPPPEPKKHIKLSELTHIMSKEKQRYKRRMKQSKKRRPPKR